MWADAVFEGGGVKSIGLVGALSVAEKNGYKWRRVAGTSAGSIIASLVAAGYTAEELSKILFDLDFSQFLRKSIFNLVPMVGPFLNLFFKNGLYSSSPVEEWVDKLLKAKGISTFADLDKNTDLQIVVSDITHSDIVAFPRDLSRYNIKPDEMSVAKAVRMSCSIPFFFSPVPLQNKATGAECYMVDGGLLSNFPIWLFDREAPRWPTLGFRLGSGEMEGRGRKITGTYTMATSLLWTMIEAHDNRYIHDKDEVRTIQVPSLGTSLIDFDISKENKEKLFKSGVTAAESFFSKFNFDSYLAVRGKKREMSLNIK